MKKLATYPKLVFVLFFLVCYGIMYAIGVENPLLRTVFSITLALIISPRKKKIQTQTGEKTQVTWVFLKEPIFLD